MLSGATEKRRILSRIMLSSASAAVIGVAAYSAPAWANADSADDTRPDQIVVTGTRRTDTVQTAPINIAAVTGDSIQELGISDLAEVAAWVPGVHIVDQGARSADRIVVRGLNADPISSSEGLGNSGGGTVATYVGEIPLYVDLKLNDMERVELLLGPQGTLYGAGTLGGAIRYIPVKPKFDGFGVQLRQEVYGYSEASKVSFESGATINIPLGENLAFRGSVDYLDDSGFIDYVYTVRQPGVSNPDPDFSDPADVAANLVSVKDANFEETLSGRAALRWAPSPLFDATATYYFQFQDVGARQISSRRSVLPTGKWEANKRVLEPNERDNQLVSLEIISDLGFAELTSASGYAKYKERGQRDQTDLLITLEYSYEAFPSFTSFTREDQKDEIVNQEIRLVSKHGGPISWIVGGFYNNFKSYGESREFTPGYDQFAVDNFGGVQLRPDALEYFSVDDVKLIEKAVFGEISYEITDRLQITGGLRYYDYKLTTMSAVDFPLLNTVFFGDPPDQIILDFVPGGQSDSGVLYKINASYKASDSALLYLTVSEGYRIGNSNGVAPCPVPLPPTQIACALPNEMQYFPDKTKNYELGAKTTLFDGRLLLNGAIYYIDWKDPQVSSATENAAIPITINGTGARSYGAEVFFNASLTDHLSVRGSYAYNKAELTEDVPNLIRTISPPGFTPAYEDGLSGDRLPGYPQHQASAFVSYKRPLANGLDFAMNYGVIAQSEVLTRTGGRGSSLTLDGYSLHNVSATLSSDRWRATLFVDNLFNNYVESGVISSPPFNQIVSDINDDPVHVRSFQVNVLPPRVFGIRLTYDWSQ